MKKGFTILELLVSIIILSVVLTFAMNLFLRVRGTYTNSKNNIEMEVSRSIIMDAVMSDVDDYIVKNLSCNNTSMSIQFQDGNTLFTKKLVFTSGNKQDIIKYYNQSSEDIGIVRILPKGSLVGNLSCTSTSNAMVGTLNHITQNISDQNGNDYSLDMFIVLDN